DLRAGHGDLPAEAGVGRGEVSAHLGGQSGVIGGVGHAGLEDHPQADEPAGAAGGLMARPSRGFMTTPWCPLRVWGSAAAGPGPWGAVGPVGAVDPGGPVDPVGPGDPVESVDPAASVGSVGSAAPSAVPSGDCSPAAEGPPVPAAPSPATVD